MNLPEPVQSTERKPVRRTILLFLGFEAVAFMAAALTHFGVLMEGLEHRKAGTAESVIGSVLIVGFILGMIRPVSTRAIGLAVQAFALFGTLIGVFTIAVGVGPRTLPDISFHIGIIVMLVAGLVTAARAA